VLREVWYTGRRLCKFFSVWPYPIETMIFSRPIAYWMIGVMKIREAQNEDSQRRLAAISVLISEVMLRPSLLYIACLLHVCGHSTDTALT
jgi:hypothetical protein